MKLDGTAFTNSPTCHGVSFAAPNSPADIARIEINGRYPEDGWSLNELSHEMVYIIEGTGQLEFQDDSVELKAGDAIHVPPDTAFAWNGHMTMIMACDPPFEPNQYVVKKGAGA